MTRFLVGELPGVVNQRHSATVILKEREDPLTEEILNIQFFGPR